MNCNTPYSVFSNSGCIHTCNKCNLNTIQCLMASGSMRIGTVYEMPPPLYFASRNIAFTEWNLRKNQQFKNMYYTNMWETESRNRSELLVSWSEWCWRSLYFSYKGRGFIVFRTLDRFSLIIVTLFGLYLYEIICYNISIVYHNISVVMYIWLYGCIGDRFHNSNQFLNFMLRINLICYSGLGFFFADRLRTKRAIRLIYIGLKTSPLIRDFRYITT